MSDKLKGTTAALAEWPLYPSRFIKRSSKCFLQNTM